MLYKTTITTVHCLIFCLCSYDRWCSVCSVRIGPSVRPETFFNRVFGYGSLYVFNKIVKLSSGIQSGACMSSFGLFPTIFFNFTRRMTKINRADVQRAWPHCMNRTFLPLESKVYIWFCVGSTTSAIAERCWVRLIWDFIQNKSVLQVVEIYRQMVYTILHNFALQIRKFRLPTKR